MLTKLNKINKMKTQIIAGLVMAMFLVSVFSISSVYAVGNLEIKNITGLKEKVAELKEKIKEKGIESIKSQVKECRERENETETDECKAIKEGALSIAKERFSDVIDRSIERLKEIEAKVQASDKYTEEEKSNILKSIDESIASLEALKAKVPQLSAGELREEIKKYKVYRELFQDRTKLEVEKLKIERVGLIVQKADALITKLNRFLEKRNATDNFSAQIDEFQKHIDLANKSKEEAMSLWLDLKDKLKAKNTTAQEIRTSVKAIHQKLEDAKAHLKDAREILKSIIAEVKGIEKVSEEQTAENKTGKQENNTASENETEIEEKNETQLENESSSNETGIENALENETSNETGQGESE